MKWTPTRIIALFLGLWVALAPAMYAVPAAAMTPQMIMSDDGDDSADAGSNCCDGCPDTAADRAVCALMCLNLVSFTAIADQGKPGRVFFREDHWPGRDQALSGFLSTPDPTPPKLISHL